MRLRLGAALALTMLTGIGGHYLNCRPDRALFFGALLSDPFHFASPPLQ
jgi:hypothetical protein